MLPLTFADKADYDLVRPDDKVAIVGLQDFQPGKVNNNSVKKMWRIISNLIDNLNFKKKNTLT